MRKLMIGAAVAATALGGAAVAFGDSASKEIGDTGPTVAVAAGPPIAFGPGPDDTFARDLAAELGGVTTGEVKRALKAVAEKEMARHRRELAEAISSELDGVSADQVESALEVADRRMRQSFESGEPPSPDLFTQTLADELGLSEDAVSKALAATREAEFKAHRDEAEQQLDEAVEAGRLSEKEANEIRDRIEHAPPMLDFHGKRGLPPPPVGTGFSFGVPAG
jgi:DNA-binding transcriptional ArsR family regulator